MTAGHGPSRMTCATPVASSSTSRGVTRGLDTHADLEPVVDRARTDSVVASPECIDVRSLVEPAGLWASDCHDAPSSVVRASWKVVAPDRRPTEHPGDAEGDAA